MRKLLVLSLCLAMHAQAALTFASGSTNTVNCGSSTALDNVFQTSGTMMVWIFPTTLGSNTTWTAKCTGDACGTSQNFFNTGATLVQFQISRGTANLLIRATYGVANALPTIVVNAWSFVAVTYDSAGANGNQQLWGGNLTTPVAEATVYNAQTVGSGTITDQTSGSFMIGGRPSISVAMIGRIGAVHVVNTRLSLGQLKAQQYAPHPISGSVLFTRLGFHGTSTQADWSGGGNNCTVTGATQSADAPIAPFSAFLHRVFPMLPAWWLPTIHELREQAQ